MRTGENPGQGPHPRERTTHLSGEPDLPLKDGQIWGAHGGTNSIFVWVFGSCSAWLTAGNWGSAVLRVVRVGRVSGVKADDSRVVLLAMPS